MSVAFTDFDPRARKHILRLQASNESKRVLNQKIQAIRALQEIAEDKIIEGDDWRSTYRLPELFGINERKKSDLLEHLPEVRVKSEFMDESNMAAAAQATLDHFQRMSGDKDVQARVIGSAVDYGTGIKLDGVSLIKRKVTMPDLDDPQLYLPKGKEEEVCVYYGLAPEFVDIRDAFPDPNATMDHDPCGQKGMGYFYRRIIFTDLSFFETFGGDERFNISEVEPVQWAQVEMFGLDRPYTKHEQEEKHGPNDTIKDREDGKARYYVAFEGWCPQEDEHVFMVNGRMIYEGAMPLRHKKIPVTFYYNYRRDDSLWGISEAEINAPFILIKEVLVNLMIDNAKLTQQPAIAISGDINFDPDENELEPGALFTLQGLNGGRVGDAIQPLTFGSSVEPAMAVKQILEDMQIQITGDDIRSLMVSPQELATQTLSKREALKKRIRKNVMLNTIKSEMNSVQQQFSNICQFLARPYQDMSGKWKHHTIYVEGFKVNQRTFDDKPEFTAVSGQQGVFRLNGEILDPEYVRFELVEVVEDAVQKEQELQALQWWMQTIFTMAQANPQLLQNTDLELLAKQAGTRFTGLDVEAIFNASSRLVQGMDEMGYYIHQMALGIKPLIPTDGNNLKRLERFRRFARTKEFKLFSKESKEIFNQTVIDIAKGIREEKAKSYSDYVKQIGMAAAGPSGQQGGVSGAGPGVNAAVRPGSGTVGAPDGGPQSASAGVSEGQAV
ncbi:MAG: hypothetical protein DWQ49_08925 [Bacteroidetes bacterium]|nr:MAG: hypothetical protein DWQ49_08925 [Bacteroidota bacterium]